MSTEANKKLVTEFMHVFGGGDVDKIMGMMSDKATWTVKGTLPGLSGTHSKAQFKELLAGIGSHVKGGISLTPVAFTAEGDRVAVETKSHAALHNGRVYQNEYHFLFEVRNGKIDRVVEYLDTVHTHDIFLKP
jgi:ketosteroid isomerase-like protein